MSNLDNYIDIKEVYDFDEAEKRIIYEKLKKAFRQKCQADDTLSNEYKNYVDNLDNINVEIEYGCYARMHLSWIEFQVDYQTTEYYKTDSKYTGEVYIDYTGKAKVSNVQEHYDYKRYTANNSRKVSLISTNFAPIVIYTPTHVPNVAQPSKRYFKRSITDKNLPQALQNTFGEITESNVNGWINRSAAYLYKESVKDYIKKTFRDTPQNLKITEIIDYSLSSIDAYYGPCNFKISVCFKGQTYTCNCKILLDKDYDFDVKAIGPNSQHYSEYQKITKKYGSRKAGFAVFFCVCAIIFSVYTAIFAWTNFTNEFNGQPGTTTFIRSFAPYTWLCAILTLAYALIPLIFSIKTHFNCSKPYTPSMELKKYRSYLRKKFALHHFIRILISISFSLVVLLVWYKIF